MNKMLWLSLSYECTQTHRLICEALLLHFIRTQATFMNENEILNEVESQLK